MIKHISWRYIFWMLIFLGIFVTASILGMFFWMTGRINQIEQANARDLISLSILEDTEQLKLSVEDYAFWTFAYEAVKSGDAQSVDENIGSGATETRLFDQIFIFDPAGTLIYGFDEELGAGTNGRYSAADFAQIWDMLQDIDPTAEVSITAPLEVNGAFYLIAAAWVTPEYVERLPPGSLPALLGVLKMDAAWLTELARKSRLESVAFVDTGTATPNDTFIMPAMDGTPFAALQWQTTYSGTFLRREAVLMVTLACLGLILICLVAARYFHSQHLSLERARQVAATDLLTGLHNRAGLEEFLRKRDVVRDLENGHFAVLFVDLDDFKLLNDTFGHEAGDTALKVTATRLREAARLTDLVARLGGDEFVCIVTAKDPEKTALAIAERLISQSATPIVFDGHSQVVMSSIGISVATPGTPWETLLSQSDAAMYLSKKKKTKKAVFYREDGKGAALNG